MAFFEVPEILGVKYPWYGRPNPSDWIKLKQYIYQRDQGICQYCKKPTEYINSHCHHTLEITEGGTNHPSNLKTLCHACHKNRHPFMKSIKEKY